MITHVFNNGWGDMWEVKKFEKEILDEFLSRFIHDDCPTVIIHSTWYDNDYHKEILEKLKLICPRRLVLVSMMDPSIVNKNWFDGLDYEIYCVGYYPGIGEIDAWALIVDRYFDLLSYPDVMDSTRIDKPYMCLNRKPHWHRMKFYHNLENMDLLDFGIVSMGGNNGVPIRKLSLDSGISDIAPNSGKEQNGINNDICSLGHPDNWYRCFVNIVTETVWGIEQKYFVSEKIYKPIVGCRPFLVYDPNGAESWLVQRGFETFTKDFTDITDLDLTFPENIAPFIKVLCSQPVSYYRHKFVDLEEKISYNKSRFNQYCSEQKSRIRQGIICPT